MTAGAAKAAQSWLVDKSAYVRLGTGPDAARWAERVDRGLVWISTVTRLELGYSARSADDLQAELEGVPLAAMPVQYLTPAVEDRAVQVQVLLADQGQHRGPSVPDLLIAAAAELASLTVLHLDKDFEIIADITGQPVERIRTEADPTPTKSRTRRRG
jgi:predicted nucleic acid-binding protein